MTDCFKKVRKLAYQRSEIGVRQDVTIVRDGKGVAVDSELKTPNTQGRNFKKTQLMYLSKNMRTADCTICFGMSFINSGRGMSVPTTPNRIPWFFCMNKFKTTQKHFG